MASKRKSYESLSLFEFVMLAAIALPFMIYLTILIALQKRFALWPIGLNEEQATLLRLLKIEQKNLLQAESLKFKNDVEQLERDDLIMKAQIKISELQERCINAGIAEWRVAAIVSEF